MCCVVGYREDFLKLGWNVYENQSCDLDNRSDSPGTGMFISLETFCFIGASLYTVNCRVYV